MTTPASSISAQLPCFRCGYDLRAHPADGQCPECGASVAVSQRVAAVPLRPVWRDADPRWRRRMLAGTWVLVLIPLLDVLQIFGWSGRVRVPNLFGVRHAINTLNDSLLTTGEVYAALLFCIGAVLLFSRERGRRPARSDWTRRWGILCSYVTLLLSAAPILFISALVGVGIAALLLSMPLKDQPSVTRLFVEVGAGYLRFGPQPHTNCDFVLVAFSSITMLFACVPLFNALRSCSPGWLGFVLLAPLGLFSLVQCAQAGKYCFFVSAPTPDFYRYGAYFRPNMVVQGIDLLIEQPGAWTSLLGIAAAVEITKWVVVLFIAIWLSIAQAVAASR